MTNNDYIRKQPADVAIKLLHEALVKYGKDGIKAWLKAPYEGRKREACLNSGERS